MARFFKNNGLSIVMFAAFLVFWAGQSLTGWAQHNDEQREHGKAEVLWSDYVRSGDFLEATFENWESEFLQMAAFLILSAVLIQRGAAESKKPPEEEDEEEDEEERAGPPPGEGGPVPPDAPWPVHRGGLALQVYKRSLSIALGGLFILSFVLHGVTGVRKYNEEALAHGSPPLSLGGYMTSSDFWFESFQNWQSEFMSIGVLVVLSIFLRQSGSPESKPVHAAHAQTGAS